MASAQAQIDAIKDAVSSLSTCTTATVVTLKSLLQLDSSDNTGTKPKTPAKPTKTPVKPRSQPSTATKGEKSAGLSTRDQTVLATLVINATLKSLTEAAKKPASDSPPERPKSRQSPSRRALRRSLSTPLSPLQTRTLNRVATSPNLAATKTPKLNTATSSSIITKCQPTAECARLAFACLRSLKGPVTPAQTDFQIETGGTTLVSKLIVLGLHEQAASELLSLKRRLVKHNASLTDEAKTSDLLDYGELLSPNSLATVVACQIQALKLIATRKRPTEIAEALPYLRTSHPTSPINLLSKFARSGDGCASKAARHMAMVSQTLLAMMPSVSSSEDAVASEARLSVTPAVAFETQALAFRLQVMWWTLAGHKGSLDDELLAPFSRCIRCFVRRYGTIDAAGFKLLSGSYEDLMTFISASKYQYSTTPESPMASIYSSLGSAAHVARLYDDASRWYVKVKMTLQSSEKSSVRACSVSARLLAVSMKQTLTKFEDSELLEEVTMVLNGPLSGTTQDVNDLLESLLLARRSAAGALMSSGDEKSAMSSKLKGLLYKFLLGFPRFVLRWLGTPPQKEATAKQILQFDQRRQIVMQSLSQVMDGTFVIVKAQIQATTAEFEATDEVLQDCIRLLDNVHDPTLSSSKSGQISGNRVKISSLYFSLFSQLRKKSNQSKTDRKHALQALNRSIDSVKECSVAEKEKAQLATKLEVMADLCKGSGRAEDAAKSLRSICTNMVEEGALGIVTNALSSEPPRRAWAANEKTLALSRTLRSMAKLDNSLNEWTFFLPEAERAAVLEHLLYTILDDSEAKPLQLHDSRLSALLRIFTPERYPIRRFRVLTMLLSQNIGQTGSWRDITTLLEQALRHIQKKDLAEDSALAHYIPHLRNLHASLVAMGDHPFNVSTLKDCLSSWSSMIQTCSTADEVNNAIDDPEELLTHLLALNQLSGLKGEGRLRLSILELCVSIAKVFGTQSQDDLVSYQCQLATQYIEIGLFTQASTVLEDTKRLVNQGEGASLRAAMAFHLAQAEYLAGVDQINEAMASLLKASDIHSKSSKLWSTSRTQATLARSTAELAQSDAALRKGDIQEAFRYARSSVRALSYEWNELEGPSMAAPPKPEPTLAESVLGKVAKPETAPRLLGSRLWPWVGPFMRSLLQISSLYAHIGMFQETWYFGECALRIAESTHSAFHISTASSWLGLVCIRSGKIEDAAAYMKQAGENLPQEACAARVQLASRVGELYQGIGDMEKAEEYFKMAEECSHLLDNLGSLTETGENAKQVTKATTQTRNKATASKTAATRTTRLRSATAEKAPPAQKRAVSTKPKKALPAVTTPSAPKDIYQASLLASVILSRAVGYMHQHDWSAVTSNLELVKDLPKLAMASRLEKFILASKHITLSMEDMIQDPVYSVMQDSTISFPAICSGLDKSSGGRLSLSQSPPRKGRAAPSERRGAKDRGLPAFAGALKQAQEVLLEAQASALETGDSAMLHRISALLQSTAISLTAASSPREKATIRSDLTTVAIELARNAKWRREMLSLQLQPPDKAPDTSVASEASSTMPLIEKMSELSLGTDMASFQKEFIELVPKKWNVISLSLSDSGHDLCVTKFQAGHGPFVLRLPLERNNSRDADSEVFNFEHGREELLDIIKLANETSHSAKDLTTKASKNAWWDKRAELDGRLKDLLAMIESTWFGGFKGIFSQHERRPDLLARFQKSFQQILDRSLPSRSRTQRGKSAAKTPSITLDPRILDMFIGLGNPEEPDCEFDEALNDLLYFVVDILQFHGERNAYDEIDFDAMVVEAYDALRGYYQAVNKPGEQREDGQHTILVLDKALHAFPWESMPCMQGLAVSRVPSLACLRRLLLEANAPKTKNDERPEGHYVSSNSGTYILNPSSDLKNTQAYFEKPFTALGSWTGHVNEAPKEELIETALIKSEVMLYFGHGGGAQYIRAKTIRRLEKCKPATFLMGCSSAALTEAGEFECYGPIWHYMVAGCPAVVGTLWDVTDRDIDRFAGRAFEKWGLFPRGTFKEELLKKSKSIRDGVSSDTEDTDMVDGTTGVEGPCSIVEAVTAARDACRFKYLNAAAVVVYGIPVYIDREA